MPDTADAPCSVAAASLLSAGEQILDLFDRTGDGVRQLVVHRDPVTGTRIRIAVDSEVILITD